jgi:hypothetical protein
MLVNHINRYGRLETERLYDAPFTSMHSGRAIDGMFEDDHHAAPHKIVSEIRM